MAPPHAWRDRSMDHHPKRWCFFFFPSPDSSSASSSASLAACLASFLSWCSWNANPPLPSAAAAATPSSILCRCAFSGSFFAWCLSYCTSTHGHRSIVINGATEFNLFEEEEER
uniref:Uncharacterized protein n=1 Tax=Oryza glaberrima TaxID=4538 RepID=I1PL91_ORYGL